MATRDEVVAVFTLLGLGRPSDARLDEIAASIDADERTLSDVQNDLFTFIANDEGITVEEAAARVVRETFTSAQAGLGTAQETEQQRVDRLVAELLGEGSAATDTETTRTILDINRAIGGGTPDSGEQIGGDGITDVAPVEIGDTTVPAGATLVIVTNPTGSDADRLYYLAYTWNGVTMTFEVGDRGRFGELFGPDGEARFDNKTSVGAAITNLPVEGELVESGVVDDILGSEESLGSQLERETTALLGEDLAPWVKSSPQALAIIVQSNAQGWSAGRTWNELADTEAFKERFKALDLFRTGGTTIQEAVNTMLEEERLIAAAIRRYRPASFEVSTAYLSDVLAQGWTASEATGVLQAARDLGRNPDALVQANTILAAAGLDTIDENGYVAFLTGNAPDDVTAALNAAMAGQALLDVGLEDIDLGLLAEVVDDPTTLRSVEDYQAIAAQLASNIATFAPDVNLSRYGITEEDLFAAAFQRESPTGRSVGDVFNTLARIERERRAAAGGFVGSSAFVDAENRLRVQGFGGL